MSRIHTVKVTDPHSRAMALEVIESVYLNEKKWIHNVDSEIPHDIASSTRYSWFMVTFNDTPAGVLRLYYDPPLELPAECEVTLHKDVDLEEMSRKHKFVEIGRFMILPAYRRQILVALRLMKAAIKEVVERDYTHFITDVFENEPHSPFKFHTRVLGFEVIGTHLHGELNCSLTRIILTLDILKSYQRLRQRRDKIYRHLTEGIRDLLDKKLEARASGTAGYLRS
jgi:hypothetical protein